MPHSKVYPGIHNDQWEGMTDIGKIIRDAWLFDIIPEDQTCENWGYSQLQGLYEKVHEAWGPYGHLVSQLPPELREKHERINSEAIRRARELGWDPSLDDET